LPFACLPDAIKGVLFTVMVWNLGNWSFATIQLSSAVHSTVDMKDCALFCACEFFIISSAERPGIFLHNFVDAHLRIAHMARGVGKKGGTP